MKKVLLLSALTIALAGCASGPRYDTRHSSANHDSRIQFVVVHYTSASLERSLQLLTHGEVSSHYLIGDTPPTLYKLVDENQRAWHAGESQWKGRTWLNSSSIGIEIVNKGFRDTPQGRVWYPYTEGQIQTLIALLKDISTRYKINPQNIIGTLDFGSGTTTFRAGMIVRRPENMAEQLQKAIELVPQGAMLPRGKVDHLTYYANETGERHGALGCGDDRHVLGERAVLAVQGTIEFGVIVAS